MKIASVCVALLATALCSSAATAQETFRPTPQQAASIAYICKNWRPIAKEIFEMKESGKPKPNATSPLQGRIIDEIYYAKSSITSSTMAEAVGEQLCVPVIKEKFRTGEMRVKS